MIGNQAPEVEIGIGDGDAIPFAVTDRPRIGAGAFRPDLQGAAEIDAGKRAAAGTDGVDVDHRHLHRVIGDLRFGGQRQFAVDQADIGAGAAHVKGDQPVEAGLPADFERSDGAAGRPGKDGADRLLHRGGGGNTAAVALHDAKPAPCDLFAQVGQVTAHLGSDVGIDDRGRGALILAKLRQGLV